MRKLASISMAAMLLAASPALARTLIVGVTTQLTAETRDDVNTVLGTIYDKLPAGDRLIVIDANHLTQITDASVPADGFPTKKAKARALATTFQQIYDATGKADGSAKPNDLNIPELLRFIGRDILPTVENKQANVLLIGSMIFDNPRDAGFTFREYVPSDGMLLHMPTIWNISGHEHLLDGALVSLCYTDKTNIREEKQAVHKSMITSFWGKTITGQGGKVGAIMAASPACADRLISDVVSKEDFRIDRNDKPELIRSGWLTVNVRDNR